MTTESDLATAASAVGPAGRAARRTRAASAARGARAHAGTTGPARRAGRGPRSGTRSRSAGRPCTRSTARTEGTPEMFERFTKPARELVERAQAIARSRGRARCARSTCSPRCSGTTTASPYACWSSQGATAERLHAELDQRRARYVDGLDDEDAAALASIGIDLEEVAAPDRRRRPGGSRARRSRGTRGSPGPPRRCSSCRCARRSR